MISGIVVHAFAASKQGADDEVLEGGHVDVCDEGVELVGRVLVLVSESRQANADAIGDVSETIIRQSLV